MQVQPQDAGGFCGEERQDGVHEGSGVHPGQKGDSSSRAVAVLQAMMRSVSLVEWFCLTVAEPEVEWK